MIRGRPSYSPPCNREFLFCLVSCFYKYLLRDMSLEHGGVKVLISEDFGRGIETWNQLCIYGCGQVATVFPKSGKHRCQKNWGSCPIVRGKNSETHRGKKASAETKDKISEAMRGENNSMFGIHRYGMDAPMYGKKHTEKAKKLISEANSGENHPMFGKHPSAKTKKLMSEALQGENSPMFGKHPSAETKRKNSEAHKGKKVSAESRKKISEAHVGKKHTAETKRKIGEANEGKKASAETRKQQSESRIKYLQSSDADIHYYSNNSQQLFREVYKIVEDIFVEIYFAELNHEHSASTGIYLYDFVILDNKKIIEFHGDFWHANPESYGPDDTINMPGGLRKVSEVWKEDRKKIEMAREKGFEVLVVWESDFVKDPVKVTKQCTTFLMG